MNKDFFKATAVMIGYVIGVGMFGLPFVVAKAGYVPFLIFIGVFGMVQYLQHLIYANIIVVTKGYHRLPGYAGLYLGKNGKTIIFIAKMLGNFGALLAYIIITGVFLYQLLGASLGGSEFIYSTILFFICAALVYSGIGAIARAELLMSGLLIAVVIFIVIKGWGAVTAVNFTVFDWPYLLLPYGATLMALDGNGSLPVVAKILSKDPKLLKKVVRWGTFIPLAITVVFTLVVVGISGPNTTPDSLTGVKRILNDGVVFFSLIFGVLTMATSILLVAEAIKETLWWDYQLNRKLAWALAVAIPYGLFLCGIRNLTGVISIAGGVAGGLSAIMLILMFHSMREMPGKAVLFKRQPSTVLLFILVSLFVFGMAYELYYFIL